MQNHDGLMKISTNIQGFDEAVKILDAVNSKLQKRVIERIFKKSVLPLQQRMKSNLISQGANFTALADAIGFITARSEKNHPLVITGIRVKGKYKYTGYYGAWIEYGVKGVKTKKSASIHKVGSGDDTFRMWVASVPMGGAYRHDIPEQPFMRPAIDAMHPTVRMSAENGMQTFVHSEVQKAVAQNNKRIIKSKA
jgi:hypothetical protein